MSIGKLFKRLIRIFFQAIIPAGILNLALKYANLPRTNAVITLFVFIYIFGIWFHFVSGDRFKYRKPKGLYREYIKWFMEETY